MFKSHFLGENRLEIISSFFYPWSNVFVWLLSKDYYRKWASVYIRRIKYILGLLEMCKYKTTGRHTQISQLRAVYAWTPTYRYGHFLDLETCESDNSIVSLSVSSIVANHFFIHLDVLLYKHSLSDKVTNRKYKLINKDVVLIGFLL